MNNDNGLVDKFEKLEILKKEIEAEVIIKNFLDLEYLWL